MKPDETQEKTTIWIDKELTPRYSPNGWPEQPINNLPPSPCGQDYEVLDEMFEDYEKSLEKAKAESIPIEGFDAFTHAPGIILEPETFVNADLGFVEVVRKWIRPDGTWADHQPNRFSKRITVGRVKKQENETLSEYVNRCECELFVEKYFGLPPKFAEKDLVPGADYGQLVNLLSMFRDEQLAAANKRISELEQWKKDQLYIWGPIFAYCDENADRLGIGLGQSISKRVLEILKGIK